MERKKAIGLILVLFLIGSWLAGMMMGFHEPAEGEEWDASSVAPFTFLVIFAIPIFIFWKARTKIFYLMFVAALFWVITPVFFEALTFILVTLVVIALIFNIIAFKKGHISKKMAAVVFGGTTAFGAAIFFYIWYAGEEAAEPGGKTIPEHFSDGISYIFPWEGLGDFAQPTIIILSLIVIFAVSFFVYTRYDLSRLFKRSEKKDKGKEIEKDISSAVDKTLEDLRSGKDVRKTIMKCYQQMSMIFEEKGVRDEDYLTPREFEEIADENLEVTTSKISRIRESFELAKYSTHELGEEEKEKVISDLEALRDELR